MFSRRQFLTSAAALGSTTVAWGSLPESILKALLIDPDPGSTFQDAEHVVILMQENRSFDHAFGAMRGVRGFRDPRPFMLPDGNDVWFQPDTDGTLVPPFRLDIDGSNVTWIGGTPHSWKDQVAARNEGRYDQWLSAKRRGDKFPMTMGYFTRNDIPFYYALADAFTVCDYAFCSSLTGTTANRHYLFTGTIREDAEHMARVQNGDTNYSREASWTTFPERLEEAGVSWCVYQNEISLDTGLEGDQDAWLANFTDNNLEWFSQYKVRFSPTRRAHVAKLRADAERSIEGLNAQISSATGAEAAKLHSQLDAKRTELSKLITEQEEYSDEAWNALSPTEKALHQRAFCDNRRDPDYRTLTKHRYDDQGTPREINIPGGDVLAQFRADVDAGRLPAVSWLVAPERFSDHPGSAWFGAWYLSEAINILTADPDIWKKTVFILCYDENDGFFDHIPPFIAPHPDRPETGKTSPDIDPALDIAKAHGLDHSSGLGYRCPMLVISPWSRGGAVNSQVFDHTSIIMFIEKWLAGKGTPVREENISSWRRAVCGDLTSTFRTYTGEKLAKTDFVDFDANIERIHKASFKSRPGPAHVIRKDEIDGFEVKSKQEPGSRPSCPLPYELEANLRLSGKTVQISLGAGKKRFGRQSAGAAFNLYSYLPEFKARAYAVTPGQQLTDEIPMSDRCHIRIDGPNGFMRELSAQADSALEAAAFDLGDKLRLTLANRSQREIEVSISDGSYGQKFPRVKIKADETVEKVFNLAKTKRWYDLLVAHGETKYRFSGRTENGTWSVSDPAMD